MQFFFENVVSSRSKNKVAHKIIIKAGGFEAPRLKEPIKAGLSLNPSLYFLPVLKKAHQKRSLCQRHSLSICFIALKPLVGRCVLSMEAVFTRIGVIDMKPSIKYAHA